MDVQLFVKALAEARQELTATETRLQGLQVEVLALERKKTALQDFVTVTSAVIGDTDGFIAIKPKSDNIPDLLKTGAQSAVESSGVGRDDKIWEAIQFVMQVEKRPMSAQEALEALEREGFRIDGQHKRETVRNAMSRKEDVFEKVERGLFALKEWPDRLKLSRTNEALTPEVQIENPQFLP